MTNLTNRAQRELTLLTGRAANTDLMPSARAHALLTAHQRRDAGSCLCDWAELGKSYPRHLVDELARLGLLAEHRARMTIEPTDEMIENAEIAYGGNVQGDMIGAIKAVLVIVERDYQ